MWRIILRTIPPIVLLAGGIAAVIYGAKCRTIPVSVVQKLPPPPPPGFPGGPPLEDPFGDPQFGGPQFGDPQFGGPPGPVLPPGMMESIPPPPLRFWDEKKDTSYESEPDLIREVTYGGVALVYPAESAPAEIRRTYTGDAPSLCPT